MPPHPNSRREPLTSERKTGIVLSAVIHLILALVVIFVTFRIRVPEPAEEGLLVNFGFDQTGSGLFEPAPLPASPPPPPPAAGATGGEEALLTQDFEEAVEVEKKQPDPEELRRQAEARAAEVRRQQEAEAERERQRQLEEERRRREEEQRRIEETQARTRNAFGNVGNVGQTGTSEGNTQGQGNMGRPDGTPEAPGYDGGGKGEGVSFSLGGRRASSLVIPSRVLQKDGIVVVAVTVDRTGRVTDATPGIQGSTTLDAELLRVAKEAALKTTFEKKNDAPVIQKGTITYDFRLR